MKARAAIFRDVKKPLTIEEIDVDIPGAREVLLRTVAVGVCRSDTYFHQGHHPTVTPLVLGHEAAAIVEEIGPDVAYVRPGDPVLTCLSVFCGHCRYCRSGRTYLCDRADVNRRTDEPPRLSQRGIVIHQFLNVSAYAEYMLVHENALVKLRPGVPLERAALISCAVTSGLGAVLNTVQLRPAVSVAVIGCGGVGLSAVQGAVIAGAARVIAIDTRRSKLALAKVLGATDLVDASEVDPVARVKELCGGVDYSFEAAGLKVTAEQAFRVLGKGGTATIIGMLPLGVNLELEGLEFLYDRKIVGSCMGSNCFRVDMPRYVDWYLEGRLKLDELVSRELVLEQINEAFEALLQGDVVRQIIRF